MPTRKIPAAALQFDAGQVQFEDAIPQESGGYSIPIELLARSGQPIYHWYWGQVIHDMAGFRAAGPTLPLDHCHDGSDGIGFLNQFEAPPAGLTVRGNLVSVSENDTADTIRKKKEAGVPYQASIFFDPNDFTVEELRPGQTAQVNGFTVLGPATIFRQWTLRGVALCLYGADKNTSAKFSAAMGAPPVEIEIAEFTPPTPPAAPPDGASDPPAERVSDSRETLTAELQRFVGQFGAANGAAWFAAGKSWAEALELHAGELRTQLTAKDTELAAAQAKLAALPRGELTPVSSNPGDAPPAGQPARPDKFEERLGPNLARFARALVLPK